MQICLCWSIMVWVNLIQTLLLLGNPPCTNILKICINIVCICLYMKCAKRLFLSLEQKGNSTFCSIFTGSLCHPSWCCLFSVHLILCSMLSKVDCLINLYKVCNPANSFALTLGESSTIVGFYSDSFLVYSHHISIGLISL